MELEDSVCADGVTYCLRTTGNTLSFWVANDLEDKSIQDIVLAFVANGEKLEKQEIILIEEEFFVKNGIQVVSTKGNTKVDDLIESHKDLVSINIKKLEIVSNEILKQVKDFSALTDEEIEKYLTIRIFDKEEVKAILLQAIQENRLKEEMISDKLRQKLSAK
ncbi:hypothetical protein [Pedobacter sp. UC225_65]|uniref:hypothetical protein n=1 Tax=Pedobacter sp. UC225_65 TaxID=3350173 RepID=UPI003671AB11